MVTRFQSSGQAVAQLEGVAEVAFAGFGGQADGGGVLGDGELCDQGGAGSGDGDGGVAEGAQVDSGGLLDGLGGVGDRPLDGGLQEVALGLVGLLASLSGVRQQLGRGVRQLLVPRGGHGSIPASSTDTPGPKMARIALFYRGLQKLWCSILVCRVSTGSTGVWSPSRSRAGVRDGTSSLLNQRWAGFETGLRPSSTQRRAGFRDGPVGPSSTSDGHSRSRRRAARESLTAWVTAASTCWLRSFWSSRFASSARRSRSLIVRVKTSSVFTRGVDQRVREGADQGLEEAVEVGRVECLVDQLRGRRQRPVVLHPPDRGQQSLAQGVDLGVRAGRRSARAPA